MKPLVYLCGPMSGLTLQEAREWRDYATSFLRTYGIETLDPCRHSVDDARVMDNWGVEGNPMLTGKALVTMDRADVRRCDLLLCNFLLAKKPGIGSLMELAWADLLGKPIVLVMEERGNFNDHAFVREICGIQFTEFQSALDAVALQLNRK
jgi:nucleoside 2-deoxyribosyltransferase